MLDKREREKLDDEHALRLRQLYRAEQSLDHYFGEFEKHSRDLMEILYEGFRGLAADSVNHFFYQIEEGLEEYRREYNRKMDDVLEERYRENKRYYDKLDGY